MVVSGRQKQGGIEPRNQQLMRVANFPMGLMAELMSAVVFSGICDRHPGVRFVLEEAGVGWVPFLFWRFDREYDFGGVETLVKSSHELCAQTASWAPANFRFSHSSLVV